MTNRFWIASSDNRPDDHSFMEKGLNWLVEGNDKPILYVPNRQHLDTGHYLGTVINVSYPIEKASESLHFRWLGKWISIVTDDNLNEINEPVRIFAASCDDKSLVKLEVLYNVNDILALPWVPDCDIERWKQETNPTWLTLEEATQIPNNSKKVSKTEEYYDLHPDEKQTIIQQANKLFDELKKATQEYKKRDQLSSSLPLTNEYKSIHYSVGGFLETQRQKADTLFLLCWLHKFNETKEIAKNAIAIMREDTTSTKIKGDR